MPETTDTSAVEAPRLGHPPEDAGQRGDALSRALARARWATRAQFTALGLTGGAWGAHIPSVKAHYGLSEATLALVLLAGAAGSVSALFFAGPMIGRIGVRPAVRLAALAMGATLLLVLHWPGLAALVAAMLVYGAGMSVFDVAINDEGTRVEALGKRAVMSNLHAMFSVGGMAGAGLVSAMIGAGVAATLQLGVVGAGVIVLAGLASRAMLDVDPPLGDAAGEPEAHFAWPHGPLLVIGLLVLAGMTAEGVMYDWCVLYLKQELALPQATAALGFSTFSAAMALARFGADALRARVPEPRLLAGGATLAAVAMAVVLLAGNPYVALVGYALVGAGLAPVVPILFAASTRVPGVSRAAAIASVSSIGYAGFMLGPPLIGGLAKALSLTAAMGVVVIAALALALGARRIR